MRARSIGQPCKSAAAIAVRDNPARIETTAIVPDVEDHRVGLIGQRTAARVAAACSITFASAPRTVRSTAVATGVGTTLGSP